MQKDLREGNWLLNEKYGGKECPEFFADLKRLKQGEPLGYIIGWVDFLGCRIDLSGKPLIPRPETEFWVERVIGHRSLATGPVKILDLFAGSGCIGIALLKHLPNAAVDLGEIDPVFTAQIEKNLQLNKADPKRARIIQSDVFSAIFDRYDAIVANPPYIDPNKKDTVQGSVLRHEPQGALFADDAGLFFIKKLLREAPLRLAPGGVLFIEFGEGQKKEIEKLLDRGEVKPKKTEFWKDQYGKWRVVRLTYS